MKKQTMEGRREVDDDDDDDEPLTPAGRFFLQPEMNQIINCALTFRNPIDIDSIKSEIQNSIMIQHPKFTSILVRDRNGRERWRRRTDSVLDLDKHIFLVNPPLEHGDGRDGEDQTEVLNEYLADLAVSSPLSTDKPLWEIHVLKDQKCVVLRIHHALGDGISLMSMVLAVCRKVDHPDELPTISSSSKDLQKPIRNHQIINHLVKNIRRLVLVAWFSMLFVVEMFLRIVWVRDAKTAISGGSGVELWPRKSATARFSLEDMKAVKKALPNATINDVLFGVISSGLSRYLDRRSDSSKVRYGLQITGLAMVNTRPQPGLQDLSNLMRHNSTSRWGNQFGFVLLPLYHQINIDDPLQYVKRAKAMLDQKKLSLEALFSYRMGSLIMSVLGPKVATWLNYRIIGNTSFTISNVVGPQDEIMFAGNPITSFRVSSSSLSHAITMHMVSYVGKAEMQILVAKDIIPDPKVLAKYFEDALLEMKDSAAAVAAANGS